jgi:hypothetical protein
MGFSQYCLTFPVLTFNELITCFHEFCNKDSTKFFHERAAKSFFFGNRNSYISILISLYDLYQKNLSRRKNIKFREKKNCIFVVTEFVKTCDELVPSLLQRRIFASSPHVANIDPFGFQEQCQTLPEWPLKVCKASILKIKNGKVLCSNHIRMNF